MRNERSYSYYALQPLAAKLHDLAFNLKDKTAFSGCSPCRGENIIASVQLITRQVSDGTKLLRFSSLR